ncbi:MAG TPA: Holliday junction resolvase RuvX [bacterium]|nr:Holliday junction resolvase RuvX [bacterium]
MNYLGIDYGDKFVGLALANSDLKLAVPLALMENSGMEELLNKLAKVIKDYQINEIVLGWPQWHNDQQSKQVELFKTSLATIFPVENIKLADESLTSKMADQLLAEQKKRAGSRQDDVAAMLILQAYLDELCCN